MKKSKKVPVIISIVILVVLIVAFAVFLPIFLNKNKVERERYDSQVVGFFDGENHLGDYSIKQLIDLVSEEEFVAVYDTSVTDPVTKTYKGVELVEILRALGINVEGKQAVRFTASDGASKVYNIQEVVAKNNVFIAYTVNGKSFNKGINTALGRSEYEDGGPYVVIKVGDKFSQNRVKLLTKVEVI